MDDVPYLQHIWGQSLTSEAVFGVLICSYLLETFSLVGFFTQLWIEDFLFKTEPFEVGVSWKYLCVSQEPLHLNIIIWIRSEWWCCSDVVTSQQTHTYILIHPLWRKALPSPSSLSLSTNNFFPNCHFSFVFIKGFGKSQGPRLSTVHAMCV